MSPTAAPDSSVEVVSAEHIRQRIDGIQDTVLRGKIAKATALLHRTLELYGREQLALSFNGGKDSTVLLHLLRVALLPQAPQQDSNISSTAAADACLNGGEVQGLEGIGAFFFERQDDFAEVRQFVHDTDRRYGLGVDFLSNPDFKPGLISYLRERCVVAIILGTRRGDPNAEGQEHFCPSSAGWPPFMRINPILDWTYHDVWTFLRATGVPYCGLYDRGYTSLGGVHNTLPNSALQHEDGTYGPAHALVDGRLERSGRVTVQRRQDSLPLLKGPSCLTWSAGIVVVGDEILSGKVTDVNTPFLCQELRAMGWQVRKVVIVPDDVAAIAAEVSSMSAELEVVITSGGVGPTLDDVTMEGVAQAMGKPLVRNPEFEERLLRYFGDRATDAHLKMADTPEDETQLIDDAPEDGRHSPFPLVQCRNVFVLPGVPHLLQQKWRAVRRELEKTVHLNPFANRVLRLNVADEAAIAPSLEQVATEYGSEVALGSYPVCEQPDGATLLVTLESKRLSQLEAALRRMGRVLPPGSILGVQDDVQSLGPSGRSAGGTMPAAMAAENGA